MAKVNVFIDGSWLFKACGRGSSLASATEYHDANFKIDFAKLNKALVKHVSENVGGSEKHELGDAMLSTSIFRLPENFDDWPSDFPGDCTSRDVEIIRNSVNARNAFANAAVDGGYNAGDLNKSVFYPAIKPYIVSQLIDGRYQEKQVDATIVALLVKYAITRPDDYHIIVSGDKDMLPAIEVAYPSFTINVAVATTHPDALSAEQRQSSYSLFDYDFCIEPFVLEDHALDIISGAFTYKCKYCNKVFARGKAIPTSRTTVPTCGSCHRTKEARS